MTRFFFGCFLWVLGMVGDEYVEDRIAARGKCREILIENNSVKIKFLNEEDAEEFADDLRELIEKGN